MYLNCPRDFSSLQHCDYMFSHNKRLTNLKFDVSNISKSTGMFKGCTSLSRCSSAEFAEGGQYEYMFYDSIFDEESTRRILSVGHNKVASLHIGMNGQPSQKFKEEESLTQLYDGDDKFWVKSYEYCHCHYSDDPEWTPWHCGAWNA